MQKRLAEGLVLRSEEIATDIYSIWIETDLAKDARPGQFVGLLPQDKSILLPRPISICNVNDKKTAIRIVYRVAGKGTEEFSHLHSGNRIKVLGVLGNGYNIEGCAGKNILILAGGIGIPPMLELSKKIFILNNGDISGVHNYLNIVLGYKDKEAFLLEEFNKYGNVLVTTEDGSVGIKGNVFAAIDNLSTKPDVIFGCGPLPMLSAIKKYSISNNIEAYVSLEEKMACGIGACLGCVCKTVKKHEHTMVNNARICTDGPVFNVKEVEI